MKDRSPQLTVASVRKKWQPRRLLRSHKKAKHGRGHNKGSRVWSSSPLGGPLTASSASCMYYSSWYWSGWNWGLLMCPHHGWSTASIFYAAFALSSMHCLTHLHFWEVFNIHLLCFYAESFRTNGKWRHLTDYKEWIELIKSHDSPRWSILFALVNPNEDSTMLSCPVFLHLLHCIIKCLCMAPSVVSLVRRFVARYSGAHGVRVMTWYVGRVCWRVCHLGLPI